MLFGRGPAERTLSAALARAADGHGSCIVLTGTPGVGFTGLLAEIQHRAHTAPANWVVLAARGAADEANLDYALLYGMISHILDELNGDLDEAPRRALEAALGRRTAQPAQVPVPKAMLAALQQLSQGRPVLVAIDDAHLSDLASAAALRFVSRRVTDLPVCLVVVVPRATSLTGSDLSSWLDTGADARAGAGVGAVVELEPLREADARVWIEDALPLLDPLCRTAVLRLAAGRPRHLADLLRLADNDPRRASGGRPLLAGAVLPSVVRAREQLHGLPDAEYRALVARGLIDDPAAEPFVERVASGTRQRATLAEVRPVVGPDAFLAAVAADEAPPALVATLRSTWSDQLEVAAGVASARTAVRLRAEAARQQILNAATANTTLAGRAGAAARALRAVDAQRSRELFALVADLHEHPDARAGDLLRAAELAWTCGRTERSAQLVISAGSWDHGPAAAVDGNQARGLAARRRALEAFVVGDRSAALESFQDALVHLVAAVGHGGAPEDALATGVAVVLVAGRRTTEVAAVTAAVAALPAAHAEHLRSVARLGQPWQLARPAEQRQALQDALAALAGSGLPVMRPTADLGRLLGSEEEVTAACLSMLSAWPPTGPAAVDLHLSLAASCLHVDGVSRAQRHVLHAREALNDAPQAGRAVEQAEVLLDSLSDHRVLGPAPAGHTPLATTSETPGAVWSRSHRQRLRGDFPAATASLAPLWPAPGEPAEAGALLHALPYAYALRESGAATHLLIQAQEQVSAWASGSGTSAAIVTALMCQAISATTDAEAISMLRRAVAAADDSHSSSSQALGATPRLALGMALRRTRQGTASRGPLRAAMARFTDLGQMAFVELARRELEATAPQRPGRHLSGSALTAQERTVASLAAGGLSNANIALSLGISSRTVAHHLQRVYSKLGITGRRQLVRRTDVG